MAGGGGAVGGGAAGDGGMPGLIRMEEPGAGGSQSLKKDRSHAQQGLQGSDTSALAAEGMNGGSQPGGHKTTPNGIAVTNGDLATTNGDHTDIVMAGSEDPPPLDESWRQAMTNKSFGTMIDRLAQQTYTELNKTLTEMAEVPTDPPQANGVVAQGQQDTSSGSQAKKRLLMDFAHEQRDRYTKTLVLSNFSQNEEDMGKVTNVKVWQDTQSFSVMHARDSIAHLRQNLASFKVPAPNIEGAMEYLATSKASGVPTFGYIPPKRLTAKQLLRALRDMNVTLSTRLNLHEGLPQHMQEFTIANGRATFVVPGEFEVDLAVADEELSSPFYFIDFRFLFTPVSNRLDDRIRQHLENGANYMLSQKGLQGCYDFLHNFVLTHKISILRKQAHELIRGKWFDCIKVESLRRSFVVQYWAGMPGPKNWIEIGVSSGKTQKSAASRKKATPRLNVRWFRKGQEVKDEVLDFDWDVLDLEACLVHVIGKHCFGKLRAAKDGLSALAGADATLEVDLPTPDAAAPEDSSLTLRLPGIRRPLQATVEAVSGQWSLSPPSNITYDSQQRLNYDPNVDPPRLLAALVCALVQERIHKQAELLGWQSVRGVTSARDTFGSNVLQRTVYKVPGWGQHWALAVTSSLRGTKWWVLQLQASIKSGQRNIGTIKDLPGRESLGDKQSEVSVASLREIEKLAVSEVSYLVLSEQLRVMRIPHHIQKAQLPRGEDLHSQRQSTSAVYLQFSALMRDVREEKCRNWALDSIRVSHYGLNVAYDADDQQPSVRHDLRLTLESTKMQNLQRHLKRSRDRDVMLNDTGGLAVRLRTPFGEPFVEQIRTRLRSIARLESYVAILLKLGYTCTAVSLAKLSFTYSAAPELSATLTFTSDGGLPAKLKLEPADSNPHLRIRVMLEQTLNSGRREAFSLFAHVLQLTIPVMQTFDHLETEPLAPRTAIVKTRGVTWYHITYKAPLTAVTFCIRARQRKEDNGKSVRWHIALPELSGKTTDQGLAEAFMKRLKSLWAEKGEAWFGIGSGIVADVQGIRPAIERLDEFVQRYQESGEETTKAEEQAPAVKAEGNGAQQPAHVPPTAPALQLKKQTPNRPPRPSVTKKEPDVIMLDD